MILQFAKHWLLHLLHLGLELPAKRPEEVPHGVVEHLLRDLHVVAADGPEAQPSLLVQPAQAQPVLLVHGPLAQGRGLGAVDLLEPRGLAGDDGGVVGEHVQHQVAQCGQVVGVAHVLQLPLVVDVGQEVTVLQVCVQVGRVAVVLRGHEPRLHEGAPRVEAQQGHGPAAEHVRRPAGAELDDAVVLAAEGGEAAHRRRTTIASSTPLDVAAQELPALGEADGVDGRRGAQDGVGGQLGAHGLQLGGDVAEEGRRAVGVGVGPCERHDVHEGAGVDGLGEGGDVLDALAGEGVAKAVPDDQRERRVVIVVVVVGGMAKWSGDGAGEEEAENGEGGEEGLGG